MGNNRRNGRIVLRNIWNWLILGEISEPSLLLRYIMGINIIRLLLGIKVDSTHKFGEDPSKTSITTTIKHQANHN